MARIPDLGNTRMTKVITIANINAPTAAELTAGIDLSVNMSKEYDVGMDNSDSINEEGVNDLAKTDVPTMRSYHGDLTFFRDLDGTTFLPTATDCTALITENLLFYFVRRFGLPSTSAYVAGQKVEVYLFRSDVWQFPTGGLKKAKIHLWQMGVYSTVATVA